MNPGISRLETEFINSLEVDCCPFCEPAKTVQSIGQQRVLFTEDNDIGIDGVSPSPFRIPFTGVFPKGQRKFRKYWHLLAFEGLFDPWRGIGWNPTERAIPMPALKNEACQEGWEETEGYIEKPHHHRHCQRVFIVPKFANKPNRKTTLDIIGKYTMPGSTLVHDGDNSHPLLTESPLKPRFIRQERTKDWRDEQTFSNSSLMSRRTGMRGWTNSSEWPVWRKKSSDIGTCLLKRPWIADCNPSCAMEVFFKKRLLNYQ